MAVVTLGTAASVQGDIRHLEKTNFNLSIHFLVQGDIRHLEKHKSLLRYVSTVQGDIRHLENNLRCSCGDY